MHCHLDFHAEVGMAVILKVGDFSQMLPKPKGFPMCHDFTSMSDEQSLGMRVVTSSLPALLLIAGFLLYL